MKIFTCSDFKGVWPVGTSALIIAETKEEAEHMLIADLNSRKLYQNQPFALNEIDLIKQVVILNDGDY